MRGAAHQEFAGRDTHHLEAFRTFLEFAIRCFLVARGLVSGLVVGGLAAEKDGECQGGGKTELHGAIKAGTGSRANRFALNVCPKEKVMIRKLASGKYRLYSRKKNPKTGKRRNLGTFNSRSAAEKHERAVQYFKRH
jgi:hypothetical protein